MAAIFGSEKKNRLYNIRRKRAKGVGSSDTSLDKKYPVKIKFMCIYIWFYDDLFEI